MLSGEHRNLWTSSVLNMGGFGGFYFIVTFLSRALNPVKLAIYGLLFVNHGILAGREDSI